MQELMKYKNLGQWLVFSTFVFSIVCTCWMMWSLLDEQNRSDISAL